MEFQSETKPCGKISNQYRKKQQNTNIFKTVMRKKLLRLKTNLPISKYK